MNPQTGLSVQTTTEYNTIVDLFFVLEIKRNLGKSIQHSAEVRQCTVWIQFYKFPRNSTQTSKVSSTIPKRFFKQISKKARDR